MEAIIQIMNVHECNGIIFSFGERWNVLFNEAHYIAGIKTFNICYIIPK